METATSPATSPAATTAEPSADASLTALPLAGRLVAEDFEGWSPHVLRDFEDNTFNGRVGGRLLGEDDLVRVWSIRLAPGERLGAHRHVLDYFWIALAAGRSRQHTADGTTREVDYVPGRTHHFTFGPGEYLLHDLENTGTTTLEFLTTEFKNGANAPLPLDS